jgi:hypothetical protein
MKILFVIGFDACDLTSCFPFNVKHIYNIKQDLRRYEAPTREVSAFIQTYVLNNPWPETSDAALPHLLELAVARLKPDDVLICLDYPGSTRQIEQLPINCRGHHVLIVDRDVRSQWPPGVPVVKCTTATHLKETVSRTAFHQYPADVKVPSRRVSELFQWATPLNRMEIIQKMLHAAHSQRLKANFFGSHPVSLERHHLPLLKSYRYNVSPKIDGTRALLWVDYGRLWVFNRKLELYEGPEIHPDFNCTLLDSEYYAPNKCFYICDCLSTPSAYLCNSGFAMRFEAANRLGRHRPDLFRPQYFTPAKNVAEVWDQRERHSYRIDGLVFTPQDTPYCLGIDTKLFKWKETRLNTVDLQLKRGSLFCRVSGNPSGRCVGVPEPTALALEENAIYECLYVAPQRWSLVKQRSDKLHANIEWVVTNILNSAAANITVADLVRHLSS